MNDASSSMTQSQAEDLGPGLIGSHVSSLSPTGALSALPAAAGKVLSTSSSNPSCCSYGLKMLQSLPRGKEHGIFERQEARQGLGQALGPWGRRQLELRLMDFIWIREAWRLELS